MPTEKILYAICLQKGTENTLTMYRVIVNIYRKLQFTLYQLCVWGDLFYVPALKVYLLKLNLQAPYWRTHKFFCTSFCFRQEKDMPISYVNITSLYFHLMQRGETHLSSLCRFLHFHWNPIAFSIKWSQKKTLKVWVEICLDLI